MVNTHVSEERVAWNFYSEDGHQIQLRNIDVYRQHGVTVLKNATSTATAVKTVKTVLFVALLH